ncbi:MAG TPA: hypothetical protein VK106_03935 [Balneolaceae bacterium]|nr:hypothetical protein [Balneolaceae bacterium]
MVVYLARISHQEISFSARRASNSSGNVRRLADVEQLFYFQRS